MKENGFKQISRQFGLKLMTMNIHLITMTGLLLCFQVVHSPTDDLETGKDSITRKVSIMMVPGGIGFQSELVWKDFSDYSIELKTRFEVFNFLQDYL
jgi:hypothetical protein